MPNILLADDHKIVRDGIISLLADESNFTIVAEAENGIEVLNKLKHNEVDIVVMDISMPEMNGIECTKIIAKNYPKVRILILSMYNEEQYVNEVFNSGAMGFILKNSGKDELVIAIKTILSGNSYFSHEVTKTYLDGLAKSSGTKSINNDIIADLSLREIEILKLIANEFTNSEIADKLFISIRTVDAHRRNLLSKIGARNTAGLVKFAVLNNMLE